MKWGGTGETIIFPEVNLATILFIKHLTFFGNKNTSAKPFIQQSGIEKLAKLSVIGSEFFFTEFIGGRWVILQ